MLVIIQKYLFSTKHFSYYTNDMYDLYDEMPEFPAPYGFPGRHNTNSSVKKIYN